MTLFVVALVLSGVATLSPAYAEETTGAVIPDKQGGETTMTVDTPSYVTTTPIDPPLPESEVDQEPQEGSVGWPSSDLETDNSAAPAAEVPESAAEVTTPSVLPVVPKRAEIATVIHKVKPKKIKIGRYGLPSDAKRYKLKTLKAIVASVARKMGYGKRTIRELQYIWQREMRNNKGIGGSNNHFLGMWQLYYTMCRGKPWWDPVWQTTRAIRYMRGHRQLGYGKGIHAAYLQKKNRDYY